MGKFDGILLASDFDGTLFCKKKISKENSEALRYFQSEGGMFTLATGREAFFARKFSKAFRPNVPMVSLNGSVIYDLETDRLLGCRCMRFGDALELFELLRIHLDRCPKVGVFRIDGACYLYLQRDDLAAQIRKLDPIVSKITMFVRKEECDDVYETLCRLADDRFQVTRSCSTIVEIMAAESGKGNGVRNLAEILGDRVKKIVCVGDYENDIPMLKAADIGYAVANGSPAAKAAADRITVPHTHHALAAVIRDLEREIDGRA